MASAIMRTLILSHVIDGPKAVEWTFQQLGERAKLIPLADRIFMEKRFEDHPVLMFFHSVPGLLFMILGPLQFMSGLRARHLEWHRWMGRVYLVCAASVGLSAVAMPFRFPLISGRPEDVVIVSVGCFFLFALGKALSSILRGQITAHREWMIRAFAIGLSISVDRAIGGMFFAVSNLTLRQFFGIALMLAFAISATAAEIWIRYTRRSLVA
jgi:uncharacterized membrane protein